MKKIFTLAKIVNTLGVVFLVANEIRKEFCAKHEFECFVEDATQEDLYDITDGFVSLN